MTNRTRLLYIGGYGRSGSTLLDILLARTSGVRCGGELWRLFDEAAKGAHCSCGQRITECYLWGPTVSHVSSATGLSLVDLHRLSCASEFSRPPVVSSEWASIWSATFDFLTNTQGVNRVVDSSKTSGGHRRVELLASLPTVELDAFIHLWRSPPGVLHSLSRGSNRALEARRGDAVMVRTARMARGLAGWYRANRHACVVRQRVNAPSAVVSYDQVAKNTERTIKGILDLCGWPINLQEDESDRHTVAGNRLARKPWTGQINVDDAWHSGLHPLWRLAGHCVSMVAQRQRWFE